MIRLFDFITASKISWLCTAFVGCAMLAGCNLQPPAAEETKPVDSAAEQFVPENNSQLHGQTQKPEPVKPRSDEDPVRASLSVTPEKVSVGETFKVAIELNVDPGYEIHSLDASPPQVPTLLELQLPPGFTAIEKWVSPAAVRSFNPSGESVFLGESKFVREIQVSRDTQPGDYLLACAVSYQACNSRQCLRPINAVVSVKISVVR